MQASTSRPNILLIIVDQFRFPRFSYGDEGGLLPPLKDILGFQGANDAANPYREFFPGLAAMRRNAVVLRNHSIASSACIPSRAALLTGQYGTRTGCTQTDGLFKDGDSAAFPWLSADGVPTLGHWFRAAGYRTHYVGKWHISNPHEHSLERYGFAGWESSWPEPHGASINNLGFFRDVGFADLTCGFLRREALGMPYTRELAAHHESDPLGAAPAKTTTPWLAVASFTNPHDIACYPALPRFLDPDGPKLGPLRVPPQGAMAKVPNGGTITMPLNPMGFPQDNTRLPPNVRDSLANKPRCQFDYAYKVGLAFAAKLGHAVGEKLGEKFGAKLGAKAADITQLSTIPFLLTRDPDFGVLRFLQYYAWCQHVVDQHIHRVLETLDATGLGESTIVVFLADHGEYGGSHHYMMEKWHTAYQEILHVPVVVRSPRINPGAEIRQIDALTSHVDIVPTLLGLAGVGGAELERIRTELSAHRPVPPLVGADLSPVLRGETDVVREPDGSAREAVLFITDDEVTRPLPDDEDPHQRDNNEEYALFLEVVEAVRTGSSPVPFSGPVPALAPGPVRQPNHIRCVRTTKWKLVRTWDPGGQHADEWELYDMVRDANEMHNLLKFDGVFPTPIADPPAGQTRAKIAEAAKKLHDILTRSEAQKLAPWPPSA
jgi:arylsulfatase A-like enzyme